MYFKFANWKSASSNDHAAYHKPLIPRVYQPTAKNWDASDFKIMV